MKPDLMIAKAGTLISVENGCYSDYSVIGFFVVLKEHQPMSELELYLADKPDERGEYKFKEDEFLAFLLAKGLLLEIPYGVLHLGDYGRVKEVSFRPIVTGAKP